MWVFWISLILCLVLIIFPALKMSSGNLNITVAVVLIIPLVLVSQLSIILITVNHPSNNSIFGIIFILLLSTAISITEVILVSTIVTIVISFTWIIVYVAILAENGRVIFTEDIVFPHGIQKLIAVIWILLLVNAVITIVHSFKS